jgi:hypothetical protein
MEFSLLEYVGRKLAEANPYINTYAVNAIRLPGQEGRVVKFGTEEYVGISDIRGAAFYIRINPDFKYAQMTRRTVSSYADYDATMAFRVVLFQFDSTPKLDPELVARQIAVTLQRMSFSDYSGPERAPRITVVSSNIDAFQVFREEINTDYNGIDSEPVVISIDATLRVMLSQQACDDYCAVFASMGCQEPTIPPSINPAAPTFCERVAECNVVKSIQTDIEIIQQQIEDLPSGGLTCDDLPACPAVQNLQDGIEAEQLARETADTALQNNLTAHTAQTNPHQTTLANVLTAGSSASNQSISDVQQLTLSVLASLLDMNVIAGSDLYIGAGNNLQITGPTILSLLNNDGSVVIDGNAVTISHAVRVLLGVPELSMGSTARVRHLLAAVNGDEPVRKAEFDAQINTIGRNRGSIDCSTNPNYPASITGDRWEVLVAGKIGGASGIDVQVWDEIVCNTDTAGGNQATAGSAFYIVQGNVDQSTEVLAGLAKIATLAQTLAGGDDTTIVTPFKLSSKIADVIVQSINAGDLTHVPSADTVNSALNALASLIPSSPPSPPVDYQIFTTTGTQVWNRPTAPNGCAQYTHVEVVCIGGGGGGGSGRKGAAGTVRCGGGGGAGAGYSRQVLPYSILAATETVIVGAGGAGGSPQTNNSNNGFNGAVGGLSSFGTTYIRANGGNQGAQGTTSTGTGGTSAATQTALNVGAAGANASTTGGVGAAGGAIFTFAAAGGGAGGGITSGNVAAAGGNGGGVGMKSIGAATGGGIGLPGGSATGATTGEPCGGGGGAGGGASISGNAGDGSAGATYGGGGGGGGAAVDGVGNSGRGGRGGDGIVIVITR